MPRQHDPVATARVRAVHQVSDIGFRPTMEDRHVLEIHPGLGLYGGVYDGHGGMEAAELVAASLHKAFFQAFDAGLQPPEAFRQAYRVVEERLQGIASGTTATTVFLRYDELSFAHVGDGGILVVAAEPISLTRPHRVDDPAERSRIISAGGEIEGGYVVRGLRGLMPTRSFGDSYFRPVGVIAVPSVGERRLNGADRFLVVACDGLFDVLEKEQIAQTLLQSSGAQEGAEGLRDGVLVRGGTDNLTIVVIEFGKGNDHSAETAGLCPEGKGM
ncbi:MAG: PP2C family protein-serine/threonine phosphatase [candidate division NC10 bacterium]|nr:protein serine/threonine phosphatase 2C family protein [candidate division NC10 bacterium]